MVAAVVLAAGGSTRFGESKQLVRLGGETLVKRAVETALQANCAPVIIVVGENEEEIRAELSGLAVEIVPNAHWQEGISASIRAGIRQVRDANAVVLLTCDQPLVRPTTLQALMELHRTSGKPIVAAKYSDTLGIPALFDRSCFPDLLALQGDHGAKGIILARRDDVAAYDFPEGAIDIDRPSDLQLL
jgi:molybdenum cofactor cytidylyltransferase